ncbi:hypothetical protein M2306_003051 [Myroides gitamensis]|uniref:Lipocalin-like domain-containing protein n=1 Tax=Myroides odoratus TaxID=256 RepID=A0A378U463_MYROD|nr:hypothetical protein [Myroides odoratus]MCS4239263.1 hypothetical protein [Myroides odoratus]MDH6602357.1 hypothetical protein [Myroides gitamensis]QQU03492.1 hypothetical protein I6I89_17090 [Myroides odoratus]STZ69240.1 Uncharacterised protein [Myroides odoratus]
MKKNRQFLVLLISILIFSCSKSDDNKDEFDPIFDLTYTKLKNLDDISKNVFYYAGVKVGNSKTSLLIPGSMSCRASEYFGPLFDPLYPSVDFTYIKYQDGEIGCKVTNSSFFSETSLVGEGQLFTTIRDGYIDDSNPLNIKIVLQERSFKGILEIGFQGEYLRIEDRMSTYKREDPNEKVYLYFKK